MQKTSIPAKFLVPWAQNDTAKVEVPVTTTDPTRASQSLGFPPLTEQPPEVGGVPPQGEDFNGGLNQIARAIWWMLQGGGFPYDSAFANASQIGGYINSAVIPRADGAGFWLSTADNNLTNPDATDGTAANWAPLGVYGTASISVSSTDVTVYPVQAAFQTLLLSGTLTANRNVILPAWTYEWKIIDNTVRGGFTLTVKTATGSGVAISTGSQLVRGDGTNIVQNPQSIAPATLTTQAVTLGQLNTAVAGVGAPQQTISASVASNALTAGFTAIGPLYFRNPTLTNGTPVSLSASAVGTLSITVPSGATLGTISAQAAQLILLVAYNAGTPVLCIANLAGGVDLSETNLISPTTISSGATSANMIYSASTVAANSPYRVVGVITVTETTAGTWATAPSALQGVGGMAYSAMQSLGYGQTLQNVTSSRTFATTYYNATPRPIFVTVVSSQTASSASASMSVSINGATPSLFAACVLPSGQAECAGSFIVPPAASYQVTQAGGISGLQSWSEIR